MIGKKVKVLLYNPGIDCGGIETFLMYLMEYFYKDSNISISLLTRNGVKSSAIYQYMKKKFDVTSLDIEHLNISTVRQFKRKLREYLRARKFEILHLHEMGEPFIVNESMRSGIKKIFIHVHSTEMIERNVNISLKWGKGCIRKYNFIHADAIMAPSREIISIMKRKVHNKPIFWIPNMIDTEKYKFRQEDRELYRDKFGILNDTFVVGHTGRIADVKNHKFIIRVFQYLLKDKPDARLILVGDGPLKENIVSQIHALGIAEHVLLLGNREDVSRILNAFDVFIFPSKYEGLGISLVEAQCNGLPCLISDTVPKEGILTDLVLRRSLSDGEEAWSKAFQCMGTGHLREKYADIIRLKGYGLDSIENSIKQKYLDE